MTSIRSGYFFRARFTIALMAVLWWALAQRLAFVSTAEGDLAFPRRRIAELADFWSKIGKEPVRLGLFFDAPYFRRAAADGLPLLVRLALVPRRFAM
jgi:hypothetical protein